MSFRQSLNLVLLVLESDTPAVGSERLLVPYFGCAASAEESRHSNFPDGGAHLTGMRPWMFLKPFQTQKCSFGDYSFCHIHPEAVHSKVSAGDPHVIFVPCTHIQQPPAFLLTHFASG